MLELILERLDDWLSDLVNVHDALAAVEEILIYKHLEYSEEVVEAFGELGLLVRVADRVASLKSIVEWCARNEQPLTGDDNRADLWREIAGYAVQALIMNERISETINTEKINVFEIRKKRLIRGHCPDCGLGVILRESLWTVCLRCSEGCGFETDDIYQGVLEYENFNQMIETLANRPAYKVQK